MKIFTGEIPSNPYPEILHCMGEDSDTVPNPEYEAWNRCMQSILSQMREVDLDETFHKYLEYIVEFGEIHQPASYVDILQAINNADIQKIKDIANPKFVMFMNFEQYIQEVKP